MTIDRAVHKFEKFLSDVNKIMPAVILDDGSVCYNNYIVRKNAVGQWDLMQFGRGIKNHINSFYLKSSALMAAKHHRYNRIMGLNRIRDLDQRYWASYTDSTHFKELYKRTKDDVKRDIFLWRYEQSRDRAQHYQQQITQAFNYAFR